MVHRVIVQPSGEGFDVLQGESVLEGALRHGVRLPHECTFGGCGTCRASILSGRVRYEEMPLALTAEEADAGFGLMCQARADSDLVIEVQRGPQLATPERTIALVRGLRPLTADVWHLQLELPELPGVSYAPGQHLNIHLDDGSHRSFSMASTPDGCSIDCHIRRIPGGRFTDVLLPRLRPGDRLEVEIPLGSFYCHTQDDRPLLMVVTGTGISPIKSMLEALLDDPGCPPVSLYWGMRTAEDLYLDAQIRSWADRLFEFRYVPVLSRADPGWSGRRGHVQDAVLADHEDLSEHSIYLCGSPTMIAYAKTSFAQRGSQVEHVYSDGFSFQHAMSIEA
jgi:CDP-4-dehydro-6-deoxyglucose reductase